VVQTAESFLDADSIIAKDFVMVMTVDLATRSAGNQESFVCPPITLVLFHATHRQLVLKSSLVVPR
jgi:hypothetical protein